eukprot:COSAG02_NODE_359_length_23842_cov_22.550011_12_plen_87_part_00
MAAPGSAAPLTLTLARDRTERGARHSPRVSGAVLNLILGHPEVSGFAPRNAKCPVSHREMRSVRFRTAKCEMPEMRNAKYLVNCET